MKQYEVIALSVGGANNKIFNSRDKVTEDNFKEGRAEELVAGGFLKEIKPPDVLEDKKPGKK